MAYTSQLEQLGGIRTIARTVTGGDAELTIASLATTDIGSLLSNRCVITGVTSITSFGLVKDVIRYVRFAGALTLTNSATLVLPSGVNITTAAGDTAIFSSDSSATPIWRCLSYSRASGNPNIGILPVVNGGTGVTTSTGSGNVVLSTSPTLSGTPSSTTAAVNTNTTQIATTAFVQTQIGAIADATLSTHGLMSAFDKSLIQAIDNNGVIELGNGRSASAASYIDFHSTVPAVDFDARIIRDAGTNGGSMTITNTGNGNLGINSQGGSVVIQANNLNTLVAYSNGAVVVERGQLSLGRNDSAYEGGQINFRNALSNADTLSIDLYGNTATPLFRIFSGIGDLLTIDTSTGNTTTKNKLYTGGTTSTLSPADNVFRNTAHAWSSATNSQSEIGAIANLFWNGGTGNNYSGMLLRYYDTAAVGNATTVNYTIPLANLGMLLSQNTSNMVIGSNTIGNIFIQQGVLGATAIFDTNGYFGVGTNSTLRGKVHVQGNSGFVGAPSAATSKSATLTIIDTYNNGGAGGAIEFGGIGGATHCAIKGTIADGTGYSLGAMRFYNRAAVGTSAMAEVMVIDQLGNVGIGNASPSQKLTVQGNILLSAASATIAFNDINSLWIGNGNLANTLIFGTSGVERMRIDNTGVVTIPGSIVSPSTCKAWVNFNGTGTVAIRGSGTAKFNVSSITDVATGKYDVTFTTAMGNADYAVSFSNANGTTDYTSGTFQSAGLSLRGRTASVLSLVCWNDTPTLSDNLDLSVIVFSN